MSWMQQMQTIRFTSKGQHISPWDTEAVAPQRTLKAFAQLARLVPERANNRPVIVLVGFKWRISQMGPEPKSRSNVMERGWLL